MGVSVTQGGREKDCEKKGWGEDINSSSLEKGGGETGSKVHLKAGNINRDKVGSLRAEKKKGRQKNRTSPLQGKRLLSRRGWRTRERRAPKGAHYQETAAGPTEGKKGRGVRGHAVL